MKNILILAIVLMISGSATAQNYTEEDYRMFKESQPLTGANLQLADKDTPWSIDRPKRVYCLHDEGDETIVTFAQSIYFDSQWVTFSKGIVIVDRKTGDEYHAIDYAMEGFTMDKLIAVKGCNGNNVLISIRFPKLGSKVKKIDVFSFGHEDDLKPSNSKTSSYSFGENLSVKELKKKYKELSASHKRARSSKDAVIYSNNSVTTKAEFPGGKEAYIKYIKDSYSSSKKDYISGQGAGGVGVYSYVIDRKGNVKDVKIVQPVSTYIDVTVVRIIKKMPKWKPATLNGKPVDVEIKLYYNFMSQEKKKLGYDKVAYYPGGTEALNRHLTAYVGGVSGNVHVTITIDEEGNVVNPQINRGHGLTYRANARALNLVKTLKWEPAMKDGKPVRSEIMVVVRFPKTEETPWF